MFFEDIADVAEISSRVGTSVFVVPNDKEIKIPGALVLQPEEKTTISIEQVRSVTSLLLKKQLTDTFVIVRPADLLNLEAANALLKNLEEPQEKVHFVLITEMPSLLLPTILSRSSLYFLKPEAGKAHEIKADEKTISLAKKLIVAKPQELVALAEEITHKKTNTRQHALDVLGVSIEVLYKTYLINQKSVFLTKIPKFLAAYDAISQNGHIKLHLVADLI